MKLLAAVPPLLFLALYFLSFIHLSLSQAPPEEQTHNRREKHGNVTNTAGALTEENIIKAIDVLKKSNKTKETLRDMSLILWSLWTTTCPPVAGFSISPNRNVAMSIYANAKKVVKDTFANYVDRKKTPVSLYTVEFIKGDGFTTDASITVTLKCGKKVRGVIYRPHPDQKDEEKLEANKVEILTGRNPDNPFFHSARYVLPYILALGDDPKILTDSKTLTHTVIDDRFSVEEATLTDVFVEYEGHDNYELSLQSEVTIKSRKDEKVMALYEMTRTLKIGRVDIAPEFYEDCIWDDLIKKRRGEINRIIRARMPGLDNIAESGFFDVEEDEFDFPEVKFTPDGFNPLATTSCQAAEILYGGAVKISFITAFHDLGTEANSRSVTHLAGEHIPKVKDSFIEVLHHRTFYRPIPPSSEQP
eukprot:GHVS01016797.1.p1 GENE.GHVS01016797.1~~GHVS01016797.1.p1  ORF type:complete len:418 (+),score=49.68 GHVS01016797.1:323-1576(+)